MAEYRKRDELLEEVRRLNDELINLKDELINLKDELIKEKERRVWFFLCAKHFKRERDKARGKVNFIAENLSQITGKFQDLKKDL